MKVQEWHNMVMDFVKTTKKHLDGTQDYNTTIDVEHNLSLPRRVSIAKDLSMVWIDTLIDSSDEGEKDLLLSLGWQEWGRGLEYILDNEEK